jgi:homoserine O-acetyltransferase/O-succinyltransferase
MTARLSAAPIAPDFEGDFAFGEPISLEAGGMLAAPVLHYALYGEVNRAGDNVIFVAHALSGSARIADWWPRLFSEGGLLQDPRHCVIGINMLGSCYGSTGPGSLDPRTGKRYGARFPLVSIGDIVAAQAHLLRHLGVKKLKLALGASIGGMQALGLAAAFPELVDRVISIGACPLPAMGLGLNHLQRQMIELDPAWKAGEYEPGEQPARGLAMARALATCSYKSAELFAERFARKPDRGGSDRFDVAGYLDYQGDRFVDRFDANAYVAITRTMDRFELSDVQLQRIQAEIMLVSISSDWLFPPEEIAALAERLRTAGVRCVLREMKSSHGHDAFLAEPEQLAELMKPFVFFGG